MTAHPKRALVLVARAVAASPAHAAARAAARAAAAAGRVRADRRAAAAGSAAGGAAARRRLCRSSCWRCSRTSCRWRGGSATVQRELERLESDLKRSGRGLMPTAAHFIYIPAVLLLGIVIGWILGSRAAADAYAAQLRQDAARIAQTPQTATLEAQARAQVRPTVPTASRCASTSGRPAAMIFACAAATSYVARA